MDTRFKTGDEEMEWWVKKLTPEIFAAPSGSSAGDGSLDPLDGRLGVELPSGGIASVSAAGASDPKLLNALDEMVKCAKKAFGRRKEEPPIMRTQPPLE